MYAYFRNMTQITQSFLHNRTDLSVGRNSISNAKYDVCLSSFLVQQSLITRKQYYFKAEVWYLSQEGKKNFPPTFSILTK